MKNVEYTTSPDGKTLTIKVDLTKELGLSASKKSINLATTEGNVDIGGGVKLGVNVFKAAPKG